MNIEQSPTYVALPEHAKPAWLRAIRALPPAQLLAPATGKIFEGKEDCYQRLQGWGLFEGFGVIQGRIQKDRTLCQEFRYKLHSTKTLNTRSLEPRKLKDKEGKMVTNWQCNMIVKAKKDYGFNYLLSYKSVSKGSEEKIYIGTFKCLTYTHELYLNLFSFKVHEKSTVEYQALVD